MSKYKLPEQLSCPECKEKGERLIHWGFLCDDYPDGEWSWNIMNHDETSKFKWPTAFASKDAAKTHVNSILKDATNGEVFIV